jgi:uncharacterized protein YggE
MSSNRKLAIISGSIGFVLLAATIVTSNYLISLRPIYIQNNTGSDGKPVNNVSVSATGKVSVQPDIVTFTAGYHTKQNDIASVQKDLNKNVNTITKALKDAGIADKDITTTTYSITPSYYYNTGGKRVEDGQEGEVRISVKVRNMDKAGEIIDASVNAGANIVDSISFTVDDLDKVRVEARKLAAKAAKDKAQVLADYSGVSIGGLIAISESAASSAPIYTYNAYTDLAKAESTSAAPTISAGSFEITITVNATYGIK